MKTDVTPLNDKRQPHGTWIWYHSNEQINLSGDYDNGNRIGLWEIFNPNGELIKLEFYARD